MKTGTLLNPTAEVPSRLREEIQKHFPGREISDLSIRYYESVEDVGYEYFTQKVLSACQDLEAVRYLEPFISFVCLGEALILSEEGIVVYDTDENDRCTETGPFWLVTAKKA
ncbi:hypothetical protein NIES593_03535 [Hydrococcus rivularis NIES-593]|uniref:Uncharacterized protein n=1 Tax=Hydrococcus rivularis NIES-593 TaxID=1921803 RepID=A0A1U7HRD7_9CYAN|nr:hypothetical protein [Hydrococcus rivularis]OKH26156.1 hypothetical protein NIES593_03535 [Hydrococcus rivularis NIES-593]